MFNILRNLFRKPSPPVPKPARVAPPTYCGPKTFRSPPYDGVPYLMAVPDYQQAWTQLLIGDLLLDEDAAYFHNTDHRSIVLYTAFTAEDVAQFLRDEKGLNATAHVNDRGYGNRYTWVEIKTNGIQGFNGVRLLGTFSIEMRPPRAHGKLALYPWLG